MNNCLEEEQAKKQKRNRLSRVCKTETIILLNIH